MIYHTTVLQLNVTKKKKKRTCGTHTYGWGVCLYTIISPQDYLNSQENTPAYNFYRLPYM